MITHQLGSYENSSSMEIDQTFVKPDGTNNNTGSIFILGRTPDRAGLLHDGLMDDLRIYNRTLTDSEVQAVYNLGQ